MKKKYYCKICNKDIHYNTVKYSNSMCGSCSCKERFKVPSHNPNFKYSILTKKFLIKEYIVNKKSTTQIAKEAGCYTSTVCRVLKRNYIKIRNLKVSAQLRQHPSKFTGILTKQFLIKEYIINKRTAFQIAKKVGCSLPTIITYMIRHEIKRRTHSETMSNKGNPNWNNGSSFEPYPLSWTKTLKEEIRYRDGYICQICGKKEIELEGRFKKLSIHHIDYNKDNLDPNNLISLCIGCHMKTNYNREIYIEFFNILKEILNEQSSQRFSKK